MTQLSPRTGTRALVTLLLIAALAAVVWKLYIVDDNDSEATSTITSNTTKSANSNTSSATDTTNGTANANSTDNSATTTNGTATRTKAEQIAKNGFFLEDLPQPTTSADGQEAFLFNDANAISAVNPDTESIIRASYGMSTEEEITVDGVKGKRFIGASPKDGSVVEYILITNGDKLIFARGTSAFLDELIETLEFN